MLWGFVDFGKVRQILQRSWAEICCFGWSCIQLFWARVVMRKWLNMGSYESDYSADPVDDDDDSESGSDNEGEFMQE